eukprot:1499266-Rhodomonas_salina.2
MPVPWSERRLLGCAGGRKTGNGSWNCSLLREGERRMTSALNFTLCVCRGFLELVRFLCCCVCVRYAWLCLAMRAVGQRLAVRCV